MAPSFCSYKTGNGYIGYLSHGRYGICRGFSDGEDFQTGDTTQKEVEDKIGKSAMPIYAMRAETGRVSASDIGIFRSLVAESHGKMYSYSTENAVEVFDDLNSETASQYIIHADTGNNVFNGLSQLLYLKVMVFRASKYHLLQRARQI